jgi:DNA-binding MarR family transcriptional regulator
MLLKLAMHAAFFGLKRAYWGSLRVTRKRLVEMGLTAARFDLLYLLDERPSRFPRRQRMLVKKLGVTPAVVSRMLKALRETGLVARQRDEADRRSWLISLTDVGRHRIRKAILFFIRRGGAWRHLEEGLCPGMPRGQERESLALVRMDSLEEVLDRMRGGFGAGGTLYYPWHPDD